jgi:hypothetical protein
MNKQLLEDYARICIQIKDLEIKKDFLKEEALKNVMEAQAGSDQPIELSSMPGYKFSVSTYRTWTFSNFVIQSEKAIEERKREERANGEATCTEKPILKFLTPTT